MLRFLPGPTRTGWKAAVYTLEQEWNLFRNELTKHEKSYSDKVIADFFDAFIRHQRGEDVEDPLAFEGEFQYTVGNSSLDKNEFE